VAASHPNPIPTLAPPAKPMGRDVRDERLFGDAASVRTNRTFDRQNRVGRHGEGDKAPGQRPSPN